MLVADPDLELRGGGGGGGGCLDLLAPLAFFPSVVSYFFTQNKWGRPSPVPPLDPPLNATECKATQPSLRVFS